MKKTDGEKSLKPTIRTEPRLCCLVRPEYKCVKCLAVVCHECNEVDGETEAASGISISFIGHASEECLLLDEKQANINWCIIGRCDADHSHAYEKEIDQKTIGKNPRTPKGPGTI